jgi:hypothetical protein
MAKQAKSADELLLALVENQGRALELTQRLARLAALRDGLPAAQVQREVAEINRHLRAASAAGMELEEMAKGGVA